MKKEQYIKLIEGLEQELRIIKAEMAALDKKYLDSNLPFQIGDKVELSIKNWRTDEIEKVTAFIMSKYVGYGHTAGYRFFKCKKDGTKSMNELHVSTVKSVRLIESAISESKPLQPDQ